MKSLEQEWQAIQTECSAIGISQQVLFSGWYAHFKFFFEFQIGWIDEQLRFNFWKDKVPASCYMVISLIVFGLTVAIISKLA